MTDSTALISADLENESVRTQPMSDIETLQAAIQPHWPGAPGEKAGRYIGQFFDRDAAGG